MSILVYSGREDMSGKELLLAVRDRFPDRKIESIKGIKDLRERFRRPVWDLDCVILLLSSRGELDELFSVREILSHMPVILIAPDGRPEMSPPVNTGNPFDRPQVLPAFRDEP